MPSVVKSLLIIFVIALLGGILTMRPTCDITYAELRICAALGERECMECLGRRAEEADIPDYNAAAKWYYEAAELGSVGAITQLGNFYRRGQGVEQNPEKGLEWYLNAVAINPDYNPETLLAIGLMYQKGEGTEPDTQEALLWMRQAAESGHVRSMALYGLSLAEQADTVARTIEALAWMQLATIGVEQPALSTELDSVQKRLSRALSAEELAAVEKRFLELGTERMHQAVNRF